MKIATNVLADPSCVTTYYHLADSPFGQCIIGFNDLGICALEFADDSPEAALKRLQTSWPGCEKSQDSELCENLVNQIFGGSEDCTIDLCLCGTPFQVEVWRALLEIPSGTTLTYTELAESLGRPSAVRAAASAVARNPIGYLVPCHRVVPATGGVGKYRWGSKLKSEMIEREKFLQ